MSFVTALLECGRLEPFQGGVHKTVERRLLIDGSLVRCAVLAALIRRWFVGFRFFRIVLQPMTTRQ